MSGRHNVIWLGSNAPHDLAAKLRLRGLTLQENPALGLDKRHITLANARAIIISVRDDKDTLLDKAKGGLADVALAHGLSVYMLVPLEAVDAIAGHFPNWVQHGKLEILTEEAVDDVIKGITDSPGRAYKKDIRISDPSPKFTAEEEILLKRAFGDAKEVSLSRLSGGASAKVFKAFAILEDSRAGPHPLPFFVKFDRRPKILRELRNYDDCTTLFVPFWARPNRDRTRCAVGCERGILVGNFIEFSRSLSDHVRDGTAARPIHSLFADALQGWRRQAFVDSSSHRNQPLAKSLGGATYTSTKPEAYDRASIVAKRASAIGATRGLDELATAIDGLRSVEHRCAIAHGDLHPDNVQVRDGQAILIDFASTTTAPLSVDPASLDTALVLQATGINEIDWREFVVDIFSIETLRTLPSPGKPNAPMALLRDAIREIRRFALPDLLDADEYAMAIAISLFRHAFRPPRDGEPTDRRAYLFAAADKLVTTLVR